eukprot:TRINITY_DN20155_c0_g1_i1.p1 TRINITY_DN20155_c0_g1~~TRINITY_DN20155_c0_g1_i1.p1  ORF type:complete len:309 (+),score=61.36 TRINITY_DN20155_c0_g1_i1:104-1030(+)
MAASSNSFFVCSRLRSQPLFCKSCVFSSHVSCMPRFSPLLGPRNLVIQSFPLAWSCRARGQDKLMECSAGVNAANSWVYAPKTSPAPDTVKTWRTADAVCFDVDSTVCVDEGIDELAKFCGAGDAVAAWTSRAMGGSVLFEDALAARLSIIKPSRKDVAKYLETKPPRLTPGIQDLVKKLNDKGVDVYLVSGGFRQMIEPIADTLGIPQKNVFANRILFDDNDNYLGYDPGEPTSRSGGKATAVAKIKKEHGYKTLVMVGDGATDLEAKQPGGADAFICYGGIQLREKVAAASDWLVLSFDDLIQQVN